MEILKSFNDIPVNTKFRYDSRTYEKISENTAKTLDDKETAYFSTFTQVLLWDLIADDMINGNIESLQSNMEISQQEMEIEGIDNICGLGFGLSDFE